MKYLLIATNPTSGVIEWNILEYKSRIPDFINNNYARLLSECNYSWKELSRYMVIFEIEPNYEVVGLKITKPVKLTIEFI